MTSSTVSNHVLEIMTDIKKTRMLSDEEALRLSVGLHQIIEAIRQGCIVMRNPSSSQEDIIVDVYLKTLRCQDILADPGAVFHTAISGGHEASPRK